MLTVPLMQATREIAGFKESFEVFPEKHVSGKNAHDARLVAVMNLNRIPGVRVSVKTPARSAPRGRGSPYLNESPRPEMSDREHR